MLASRAALIRGFIDGGMRAGVPDTSARTRTITVYTDTTGFRNLAGIATAEKVWVGLVDRDGRLYWSRQGPADAASLADLRDQVALRVGADRK